MHTLASYFRQQGAEVTTLRAGFPPAALDEFAPDLVVLSPGPGAAVRLRLRRPAHGAGRAGAAGVRRLPRAAGHGGARRGRTGPAGRARARQAGPGPAHRRAAPDCSAGLPEEFTAGRYHSLHAVPEQVKGGFAVTAVTPDGVVMAIEDEQAGRWAVQFHPESILFASGRTGHQVIANLLQGRSARPARRSTGAGRRPRHDPRGRRPPRRCPKPSSTCTSRAPSSRAGVPAR